MRQNKYEYDAFISHAVEDKIPIANELCVKLERAGLRIWYSGKELGVGDSIEKTIERGLNRSRYGIVIFSPTYLAKNWTIREFYTLLAKEIEQQKVILPVLYNITLDELKNKDLVMADRFALDSEKGIDFVVDRLVGEIKKSKPAERKEAWFSKIWMVLIISLLANIALLLKGPIFSQTPPGERPLFSVRDAEERLQRANTGTLVDEMHGLLTSMGACSCDREAGFPTSAVYQAASGRSRSDAYDTRQLSGNDAITGRGKKVTMAVVFQVETPDRISHPDLAREVDDIFQTVQLEERENPYVRVSKTYSPGEVNGVACTHGSRAE